MAEVKFIADINLNNNQLIGAKLQNLTSDPSGLAGEGQIYYDSSANVIKFHTGSDNWVSLSSASGDITGVTAGNGLTGGGTSGGVSLAVGAGDGITVNSGDVAVTAAQTTITSVLNSSLVVGRDAHNQIKFSTDDQIIFRVGNADGITMKASGEIEATKFDGALEGNADTATALATARNIGGVSFDGTGNIDLPGVNSAGNQNTSGTADHVTITDNESTDEENQITFIEGAAGSGSRGLEADGDFTYNPSTGTVSATVFKGNIDAVNGDFDGTLEADAITVGGTALNTVIAGVTVANATTAAVATTVTISDNENTAENNVIVFAAGADQDGGNLGLESDGNLLYTPSSGTVTATAFAGNLTGNVTGKADSADTLETARNIGGVSFNGSANINLPGVNTSGNQDTSGNAATATALETARNFTTSGDVVIASTSFDGSANFTAAATIQANAVEGSMLNNNIVSGLDDIGAAIASTDEFIISDAGTIKRSDVSRLTTFLQSALTFTTNTDTDVSVANLKTRLAGGFGSNAVTIGDSNDVVTIGNDLVVTGDLTVSGDTTTVNTATLSVEDPLIVLASGNSGDSVDTGFYSKYVESATTKYAGLFRDVSASGNPFVFFDSLQAEPGTTVDTGGTGYDLADISAGAITSADGFVGNIEGDVTGDVTGNADTATALATGRNLALTGDVTATLSSFDGSGNVSAAATIASAAVHHGMLNDDIISGQGALTSGLASTDELMISDAGTVKRMDVSVLQSYLQSNLTFTTNTNTVDMGDGFVVEDGDGTEVTITENKELKFVEGGNIDINFTDTSTGSDGDPFDLTFAVPDASASTKGAVELATTAEALAGSDTARAVTPAGLAARSFKATIGDNSDLDITIEHSLGTRDVIVQCYDASSYETVYAQVVRTDANNVTIDTNTAIASNDVIVLITKVD